MSLRRAAALSLAALVVALPGAAAAETYLRLEGVDGGKAVGGQTGWIELQSFKFDVEVPVDNDSGQHGGRRPTKVVITKQVDSASPALSRANDQMFATALVDVVDHAGQVTETYRFDKVMVTGFRREGPLETMTLVFQTVEVNQSRVQPPPSNATTPPKSPWAN